MLCQCGIADSQFGNVVLLFPIPGMGMEIAGIGIPFTEPINSRSDAGNGPLEGSQCQTMLLKRPAQPCFLLREAPNVLGYLKAVE